MSIPQRTRVGRCFRRLPAAIALAFVVRLCIAQEQIDPFRPRPANPPPAPRAPDAGPNVISSLEIADTPVTTVFKMISDLTGWSIATSPDVSTTPPKVNLWVKNLTPDQVLKQVVDLGGLVSERTGNTIKVMTFEEYARLFGVEKRVFQMRHTSARDAAQVLQSFVGEKKLDVRIKDSGSKLVVLAPQSMLQSLTTLIESLDVPLAEDTTRVVTVQYLEPSVIVPALEGLMAGLGAPVGASTAGASESRASAGRGWTVQYLIEPKLKVIVLRGLPSQVERMALLIEQLDVKPEIRVESYPLRYTNARQVYDTISGIVEDMRGSARVGQRQRSGIAGQGGTSANRAGTGRDEGLRRLKVAVSEQNNRIIVEGSPLDHEYLADVIDAVDQPLPTGTGGTRVYRLRNSSAQEVADVLTRLYEAGQPDDLARQEVADDSGITRYGQIEQTSPRTEAVPTPEAPTGAQAEPTAAGDVLPIQVTAAPEINAVIVRASAGEHAELATIIKELDEPRDQVILEVKLVQVRSTDTFEFGVEAATVDLSGSSQQIGFTTFGIGDVDSQTGDIRIAEDAPFGLNYAIFNPGDYSLVLNALRVVGETRVTSSPKILAIDNVEGRISQVNQEPFDVSNQGQATTVTAFGGFVDAGTTLAVTPHIGDSNSLRLDYNIILSTFGTRTNPDLPPPRLQNSVSGTVRVPDGQVVVLGGLLATRNQNTEEGVPILMDIPFLGKIFKSTATESVNDTLFVFVRPVVIRDPKFRDLLYLSDRDRERARVYREEGPSNPLKLFGATSSLSQGENAREAKG